MNAIELVMQVAASTSSSSSSSSDSGSSWFALLFLLTGPAYFFFMYARYRNAGERHRHEQETVVQIANVVANDVKVGSVEGSREAYMSGANASEVRG